MKLISLIAAGILLVIGLAGCDNDGPYQQGYQESSDAGDYAEVAPRRRMMHSDVSYGNRRIERRHVERREYTRVMRREPTGRGSMPTIDCKAAGGVRTINPNTGRPSCFVPNYAQPVSNQRDNWE